jgi:hypothetical protein
MELIATIIITAASLLLFGYWFRYTCMLILSAKTAHDYASELAAFTKLDFNDVQSQLRSGNASDLERLRTALDRDYAVLNELMEQTKHLKMDDASLEHCMLQMHYRVSRIRFHMSKHLSQSATRRALEEMSSVVAHFANVIGERALTPA